MCTCTLTGTLTRVAETAYLFGPLPLSGSAYRPRRTHRSGRFGRLAHATNAQRGFFSCYFSLGRATGFELGVVDRKLVTLVIPRLLFTFNKNLFSVFESVHAAGR